LLGENGSGKSTVIKILSGYHSPDSGGEIHVGGRRLEPGSSDASYAIGCRFVHQDLGLVDSCSIADNLALNSGFPSRFGTIRGGELRRSARVDLDRVGLDLDPGRKVATLSPAERTGVAVARALREDPSNSVALLVLDEPTATLPEAEVERLLSIIRVVAGSGVGVLYVTHRLDEVFRIASNITVLRDGCCVARVKAADVNRSRLVTLLVGNEFDELQAASDELPPEHDDPLLVATDVCGGTIRHASLEVRRGDVVGVAGITGSGRESVLSLLFGALPRSGGTVQVGNALLRSGRPDQAMKAGLVFMPADRKTQGGFFDLSIRENVTIGDLRPLWRWPKLSRRREVAEVRSWIARLAIRPASTEIALGLLSGGNQQKLLFAKWLRRNPMILLLDEPTQGVDVGAKAELHFEILSAARDGAGVVVSSTDTDELAALCHRVLVLRDGRIAAHLVGNRVTSTEISRACLATEDRSRA
ncbi:MAG: ribose transport system ATP-binding protein, partial [Ilumatobacteraceae bacterium]